jgi:hypothetical protein
MFGFILLKTAFPDITWKHIEFKFLEAWLRQEAAAGLSKNFDPLMGEFLKTGFHAGENEVSQIWSLFEDIINYIPTIKFDKEHCSDKLVNLKLIYDVLMFIQHYKPQVISPHFEESLTFQQLQTFKGVILLISSLFTFRYGIHRSLLLNLKEKGAFSSLSASFILSGVFSQNKIMPEKIKEQLRGSLGGFTIRICEFFF